MGNDTQLDLSPGEVRQLHRVAGILIPGSEEHGVPGADDQAIFADIVQSIGRDIADVRTALRQPGRQDPRGSAAGDAAALFRCVARPGARHPAMLLSRRPRVARRLDVEPRPPFPKGHVLEQGDWSLLDPVRKRAPFWRDDRAALIWRRTTSSMC